MRGNQVHPDIHLNIFIPDTQYEIVVSYTYNCKERVEYKWLARSELVTHDTFEAESPQ